MSLYVESSAVLAWLLAEPGGAEIGLHLARSEVVLTSELTALECHRALIRHVFTGDFSEADAARERSRLQRALAHWVCLRIEDEVLERARRPFPVEPIRSLDAIHLASALLAKTAIPEIGLLTLDGKVRECGLELGFKVFP